MTFPIPKLPNGIPLITITKIGKAGDYDSTTGLWNESDSGNETFEGAVLPLTSKDMNYSEGTYTRDDRKLYTHKDDLEDNEVILVQGKHYIIDAYDPYDGLIQTDFRRYFLKRFEVTVNR